MAQISIAAINIPGYHEVGTLHELRVFSDRSWTANDDSLVPGRGNSDIYYVSYTLNIVGTVAHVPSVVLYSNQDALNYLGKIAKYTAQVFVDGAPRDVFEPDGLGAFRVPSTPLETTWGALETYNAVRRDIPASGHPTIPQVENLIDIAIGTLNDASDLVKGRTYLSIPPDIPSHPEALGSNDPKVSLLSDLRATGVATLTAGIAVTISAPLVLANSEFDFRAKGEGIQGVLHAINIVPGVSFDAYSTEGGDAGPFRWLLY